ncbi:glycoside hydrolase family 65 protein [Subtercola boreus]|uniref:Family 65 glycosyl hydrolase n=1 Tax=Subtercola boreus TaxID=120213 RepID=A0A3E0WAN4_9MICO|nr:glycosyl hydrolase family 65 protein [Subtercola boreus]RFA21136.1 family 65 glycosyl hydrolase [Subtercola boreus]RFA21519.1 family 65 glycosyl hydrolase [Subtercola boreus]RFA27489.1 family 65 glycosyl hydrolase [Subtercola boreus]
MNRGFDRDRFPVDPWALREVSSSTSDVALTETLFAIGNGYLGMRGNNVEGRKAHEHGTFINGLHETFKIHHAEDAYGFAEVGQTIVNVPDSKVMRLYVDDEPFSIGDADVLEYERSLNFREGVLRRTVLWQTPSGKLVQIVTSRMVSFSDRHLAVMTMNVTVLNADAALVISSQLINRQDGHDSDADGVHPDAAARDPRRAERIADRVFRPGEYWQEGSRSVLSYRTNNSRMSIAVATDHTIETENEYDVERFVEPDISKDVYAVRARQGASVNLTKTVSYHTSRSTPTRELIDRCARTLDRTAAEGVAAQFDKQRLYLADFWERSDAEIVGRDDLQQAVRWNLFQVAQAAARADGLGIAAKGVTGSGYSGHYFWDTEIYVIPFLAYTNPMWARNALRQRQYLLPAARKRAQTLSEGGALFPWRTINGEEASAYYAAGTAQYHINADITYALAKYVRATGDLDFLASGAIDIAVETARMWATLGFWRSNGEDKFEIHGVTGPDEYTTVVNNNLFTNVMARFNLRYAAQIVAELTETRPAAAASMRERLALADGEVVEWERAAAAMFIPYSDALAVHPQDEHFLEREVWDLANTPAVQRPLMLHFHPLVIYRFQVLKQADVVLALFLQGDEFSLQEKTSDFDYYDPLTTSDSTLSNVVQSIIAAEIGDERLAMEYFIHTLFVDLSDLHGNTADGVHIASAGGVWNALVSGFGGMRDHDGLLSFDPRLPEEWPELRFRLTWQGSRILVTITATSLVARMLEGDESVTFSVRGDVHVVGPEAEVRVALSGQGPVRRANTHRAPHRREDGSVMTPSLPTGPIMLPTGLEDTR